ncbi:hypothetical protein AN640_05610 [Candidatus Epulonipiscium fishelsonii]|uniref:Uncharacterized protein n=1 Tax=Candidatus Epulonipiscium fishelsonii TaxID=77094 RepID=A0ACC8XHV2_9FIRM|nr:hypothetical protein AN640_05610 [Epulopiscium sp. SCG-D08WGA-EpuloA1]
MKTILILGDTPLYRDGRVERHINALKNNYNIIITGTAAPNIEGVQFIQFTDTEPNNIQNKVIRKLKKLQRIIFYKKYTSKKLDKMYWNIIYIKELWEALKSLDNIDLILSNDFMMLPLGIKLSKLKNIPIIADMHEYAPRQFENMLGWAKTEGLFRTYLCKMYLPKANKVFTVSPGLGKKYYKTFGVKCEILTNAPEYEELKPTKVNKVIKLVYHGGTGSRGLEIFVPIMKKLGKSYTLDLYLVHNQGSRKSNKLIKKLSSLKNITLNEVVPPEDIAKTINQYDLGLYILKPTSFNQKYMLPNKLFEFGQARLGVIMGPNIETSKYINKYKFGAISKDFEVDSAVQLIKSLTKEDIEKFKINANNFAKEENSEKNAKLLRKAVSELLIRREDNDERTRRI